MTLDNIIIPKEIKPQICRTLSLKTIDNTDQKFGKFKSLLSTITVEPLLFLYVLSSMMYQLTTQYLYLEKTCRVHFAFNDTVCDALSSGDGGAFIEQETEIQKYVSKLLGITTFIQGSFPVLLMLYLGSWSDRNNRRKPVILLPIFGELLSTILLLLNTYYFDWPVFLTALSVSLPAALTGGWPCLFLGVYSYISSITNENNKTARIGASSTIQNLALIMGLGCSGMLFGPLGFFGIYATSFVLLMIALIYGYFRINEVNRIEKEETQSQKRKFFLLNTFKVFFKKGPNKRRRKMIVLLLIALAILGTIQGEFSVSYLYTRYKFGWNEVDFSTFFIFHSFIDVAGSFVALVILSKIFKWKDASLGMIATLTTMSAVMMYSFAPNDKYFYIGVLLDIFYGTSPIAFRALVAKIVPPNELGQSNSVFGICEAFLPSFFGPIYTTVYKYTIDIFPGAYYFISLGMYSFGFFLFLWLYMNDSKPTIDTEETKGLNQKNETMEHV